MKKAVVISFIVCFVSVSCKEARIAVNAFTSCDTSVPVLETVSMKDDMHAVLVFSEDVLPFGDTFSPYQVTAEGCEITVTLPASLEAGKSIVLEARVRDVYGNSTGFSVPLWGYNKNPASVLINELTFNSSTKQIRRTELYATKSGELTGMCLYAGSPSHNGAKVIFPDFFVNAKSYILVWWCDEETFREFFSSPLSDSGLLYEYDDRNCLNICSGVKESAYSSSNGTLCICESPSPGAVISDAVVWSSGKAEKYNGFGTSEVFERVSEVIKKGGWSPSEANAEYAADTSSVGSASTRSLSRKNSVDTDTKDDWYATASGEFTPDSVNL